MDALSKLSNLQQLTLDLSGRQVSNLEVLSKLSNLQQLTLDLSGSRVSNLEALSQLTKLQKLSIQSLFGIDSGGATRAQRMSLRKIPASLRELKF
ncbi:MAG: hypothetical protein JNK38_25525 [Acidobacteria bacterium]|nr:hypothetical protein [Acidobacteriota bacterium]